MGFYPIQQSFVAGEISPKMYGRTDVPVYKHAVQYSQNFHHTPQGTLRMRRGTKYVIDAYQDDGIRLIPFQNPEDGADYVLELGAGYMRLLDKTGEVAQSGVSGSEILLNNTFASGSTNWTKRNTRYSHFIFNGTGTYCDIQVFQAPDSDPIIHYFPADNQANPPGIYQQITITVPGDYTFSYSAAGITTYSGIHARIGTTSTNGSEYDEVADPGESVSDTVTLAAGTFYVSFDLDFVMQPGVADANNAQGRVILPSLAIEPSGSNLVTGMDWTEEQLAQLQYVQDQQEGLFLVHRTLEPQQIRLDSTTGILSCTAVSFTNAPAEWVSGNYPGAVEIFQGRLYLGGTPDQPNTMWASQSGDYYDFTVPGTVALDSPFTLTFGTKGRIQWIQGKQQLLVGTDLHENIIVSETQVISAIDAQLVRESGYGSAYFQPIDVGDQVLFVGVDRIKLRALNFNYDTNAYLARDVTFSADHITAEGIMAVAYARDPDSTIYALLTNGEMRMCTYDRLQQVTAWSRWQTTGTVYSMCGARDTSTTSIWVAVNRNGTTCIEYIPSFDAETPFFLDCATVSVPTVFTTLDVRYARLPVDATTLDGDIVDVVVDGVHLGQGTVGGVVAGTVDVPYPTGDGVQGAAGILFPEIKCVSLPLDQGVMYGTAQGRMKTRNEVFLRMTTQTMPLVNGTRVQLPPFDWSDDQTERSYATDFRTTTVGWDRYARFDIEVDTPLQTDICGVFGDAEVSQL